MATSNATKAGIALFVGAVQWGIAIVVSEALYSGYGTTGHAGSGNTTGYVYSVYANTLSDLGITCRGTTCTAVPSGYVFDGSVALLGLLLLISAYYLNRAFHWRPATLTLALTGLGALGVALFPESAGVLHDISFLIAALFAGLTALVSARLAKKPFFYFSIINGLVTLAALVLYLGGEYLGLGEGGMERVVVYPVLFNAISFGSHLMGRDDWPMG